MNTQSSRNVYKIQPAFPALPPEVVDTHCERCVWVWKGGRMSIKYLDRGCHVHGRYLEPL